MVKTIELKRIIDDAFGSGVLSRDGINYAISCPACVDGRKDKRKLIIRLDDGRYHCWVCGLKGKNIKSLLFKHGPAALRDSTIRFRNEAKVENVEAIEVVLPKGYVSIALSKHKDPDMLAAKKYLTRRGLTKVDIARWRMLTVMTGQYRRRVIVPSFDEAGCLNYFVARSINSDAY